MKAKPIIQEQLQEPAVQRYIDRYKATRSRDLWKTGDTLEEFKAFCKFLKWLDERKSYAVKPSVL